MLAQVVPMALFADVLRQILDEKGLTVRSLAASSGIRYGTVASYLVKGESGRLPTVKNLVKLAKSLNVEIGTLLACDEFQSDNPD